LNCRSAPSARFAWRAIREARTQPAFRFPAGRHRQASNSGSANTGIAERTDQRGTWIRTIASDSDSFRVLAPDVEILPGTFVTFCIESTSQGTHAVSISIPGAKPATASMIDWGSTISALAWSNLPGDDRRIRRTSNE
jgi:hypothetical protein